MGLLSNPFFALSADFKKDASQNAMKEIIGTITGVSIEAGDPALAFHMLDDNANIKNWALDLWGERVAQRIRIRICTYQVGGRQDRIELLRRYVERHWKKVAL